MRLVDEMDRHAGVVIDEETLWALTGAVLDQRFRGWRTDEAHEDHFSHDETVESCAHCRIRRAHRGQGYVVACARVALAELATDGASSGSNAGGSISEAEAARRIASQLSGRVWNGADDLEQIAATLCAAGFTLQDPEDAAESERNA